MKFDTLPQMFSKKTVFIVGAGASMPYGFPSGPQLRDMICTEVLTPGDPFELR